MSNIVTLTDLKVRQRNKQKKRGKYIKSILTRAKDKMENDAYEITVTKKILGEKNNECTKSKEEIRRLEKLLKAQKKQMNELSSDFLDDEDDPEFDKFLSDFEKDTRR